ncbi:uncharacterized protein MONBRDRAFT_20037 [Monosiga brevicollis MX1]|uniref:Geranylgeranyl transferase type-2 subunit beta n=1 Tax=Monosiga brevicollis TaxID=81824 RepID=A9UTQ4_MONBE|nr:uncharacterized protein MONBRDRAFT_20037 [Monosiga brevicollis MX1]EDQ91290.1 predicted protein [Monosiga brevicollis MX1]|eukprot:XP_001743712.1 hypothetical protein [Monosiga brevicollis MX1]
MTEHMFLSGLYFGKCALAAAGQDDHLAAQKVRIHACRRDDGGYAGNEVYPSHLLYTYSAVQLAILYNQPELLDADALEAFVWSRLLPSGAYYGNDPSDTDTRFSYCALATLALVDKLQPEAINVRQAGEFVLACQNDDGGFGLRPGCESHAGQTFCCVAALQLCGLLEKANHDTLKGFLLRRQQADGGFNGRPEKASDGCYAWWVLATMAILGPSVLGAIDKAAAIKALFRLQTPAGGFSPRPDESPDLFHTHFAIAALGVLGHESVAPMDPCFCVPRTALQRYRRSLDQTQATTTDAS